MKIAITGARGLVGREVVKQCASAGHHTVQINRTPTPPDGSTPPNSEMRAPPTRPTATTNLVAALRGCDCRDPPGGRRPTRSAGRTTPCTTTTRAPPSTACARRRGARRRPASPTPAPSTPSASSNSHAPLEFAYLPVDEALPPRPSDAYALAKLEAETAAAAVARWFSGMHIACLRVHQVGSRAEVMRDYEADHEKAVRQLWGWVSPAATARACLLAVERADRFEGCEIFNIVAPDACPTGDDAELSSEELAKKYFPDAEIRGDLKGHKGFWTVDKAERVLGWTHDEKE